MVKYDKYGAKTRTPNKRFDFFGTDRQGFDNSLIKIITFCSHGEMDITIDFGSIIRSSNLLGSTINPFSRAEFSASPSHLAIFLGLSSDFAFARFFYLQTKNSNPQINNLSTYGFEFLKIKLSGFLVKNCSKWLFSTNFSRICSKLLHVCP